MLGRLVRLRDRYDDEATALKLSLIDALGRASLSTAAQVRQLHEALCFWRAYPDGPRLLRAVERLLRTFSTRPDLQRVRERLTSSGIAGTDIVYPFCRLTALWLASRWGPRLTIEWDRLEGEDRLTRALILLALPAEVPGLDQAPRPARPWLDALRGPDRTDATFLARRAATFPAADLVRDRLYEEIEVPCRLAAGRDTPTRTLARFAGSPVVFQTRPLRRDRPDLRAEIVRPPMAIEAVTRREAGRLIDLARAAMVTRERDLDAFVWADARDVRLVECGDGLQFACIGVRPERRFLLESVYGFLTLKNGVPVGYALASALLGLSEIAYNVFETFRGAEAAHVFGRLLGTVHALFGSDTYTIDSYQLGHENDEGLESGAWWFYYKLGFRPRARRAVALVRREVARLSRNPSHRTSLGTLATIVRDPVFLSLRSTGSSPPRGLLRMDRIGLAVTACVTSRFGADRERAARALADEAGVLLDVTDWRRLPPGERVAWERWGPLVTVLPGVKRWSPGDRRALAAVIRAKGGVRESAFVWLAARHPRLGDALSLLSRRAPGRT